MFDPELSLFGNLSPVTLVYVCKVTDTAMLDVVLFVIAEDWRQLHGFMWVISWRKEDCLQPQLQISYPFNQPKIQKLSRRGMASGQEQMRYILT